MRMPTWLEALLRPLGSLFERLVTVGFITTGVVLAAQTFLALFPLFIALTALLPDTAAHAVQQTMRSRIGFSGSTDAAMTQLVGSRDQLQGGITVFGAFVVLASATAFTRALQRMYEQAWNLPKMGLRGSLRGLIWLVGFTAYLLLLGTGIRFAGTGMPGTIARSVLTVVGAVLLWWWTPYLLLLGRVRLRVLLPGGILTGAALLAIGAVGRVVLPRSVRSNERQFGTIGVVFAIESWLVVIGCTIVACTVIGAVAAQANGPVGRLVRGRVDPEAWRQTKIRTEPDDPPQP